MRVALFGIIGLYNFGCEAIVRGTYRFLKDIDAGCEVVYYTYNYDYDSKILSDIDIAVKPVKEGNIFIKKSVNKLLSYTPVIKRLLGFDYKVIFDNVDCICSIGGDIYTIPAYRRKKKKYLYYNFLIDFCDRAKQRQIPVFVYGASLGPWGSYQKAVDYYVNSLKQYKYIICRENESVEYLRSVGVTDNVSAMCDRAFLVRQSESADRTKKEYIGINLSPLSFKEVYGEVSKDNIRTLVNIIVEIMDRTNAKVMFLPHVISKVSHDNDLLFMQQIADNLPKAYRSKTCIADVSGGFLGIKSQLHSCKYIISARMHCAVNAICEGVPAVFLSYSQKSVGMSRYVYGNTKWVVTLAEAEQKLLPLIEEMERDHTRISAEIQTRLSEIRDEYEQAIGKYTL